MMIHEITALAGKNKKRKRIGRGPGSGGKRAGRGQKGAKARSGYSRRLGFEGGTMPYFRRLPKMGFSNANFTQHFWVINLADLLESDAFANGGTVNADSLIAAGLVRDTSRNIKVLGALRDGQSVKVKFDVDVNRVSDSARKLITDAGGSVNETGTSRDRKRGVDRNSDDRTPKNLTKKLKKRRALERKEAAFVKGRKPE